MKYIFVLALIAASAWLGHQYYQNGKTIAQQEQQIDQLKQTILAMRNAQQAATPARPQFRLSGGGTSGTGGSKPAEKRFKRNN